MTVDVVFDINHDPTPSSLRSVSSKDIIAWDMQFRRGRVGMQPRFRQARKIEVGITKKMLHLFSLRCETTDVNLPSKDTAGFML